MQNSDLQSKILDLETKIEKYNRAYYDENKSLISDYEYDLLKKELEKFRSEEQKLKGNKNVEKESAPAASRVFQ